MEKHGVQTPITEGGRLVILDAADSSVDRCDENGFDQIWR